MDIYEIIKTRRSIRAFKQRKIEINELKKMVELGALGPTRVNQQPWEFIIIEEPEVREQVFGNIFWGIKNPVNKVFADKNTAPTAYILVLVNKDIRNKGYQHEAGSSIENMMLYAWSKGIGSVWIQSLNYVNLKDILGVPDNLIIDSLVALGYPEHSSTVCEIKDGSTDYLVDEKRNMLVPKRKPENISHINKYEKRN